jgi:hypothetical protein
MMFSIFRGAKPTTQAPYPFSKEAVEQIIYRSVSRVTPELPNPSTYEFSWVNNMIGLIRSQLSGFMNEHKLSEYLASTGMPEFEKLKEREETIVDEVQKLTQSEREPLTSNDLLRPAEFQSRHKITDLFAEFADEFTKRARGSGVELHWIGVGTWKTPVDLIPEKHLEAWKLSQENAKNESKFVMGRVEEEAMIHKYQTLIRAVPIDVYDEMMNPSKYPRKSTKRTEPKKTVTSDLSKDKMLSPEELDGIQDLGYVHLIKMLSDNTPSTSTYELSEAENLAAMRTLLQEYRKQLVEAIEFMKERNEAVPQKIEDAIKHIDNQTVHWAGKK